MFPTMKTKIFKFNQVILLLFIITGCSILTNARFRDRSYKKMHHTLEGYESRIAGSRPADEWDFYSFVGLRIVPHDSSIPNPIRKLCGGVLISNDLILTSAGCGYEKGATIYAARSHYHPDDWEEKGVKIHEVAISCVRDDFDEPTPLVYPPNNYRILRLREPYSGINFALLPDEELAIGDQASIAGIGFLSNDEGWGEKAPSLRYLITHRTLCKEVDPNYICLKDKDARGRSCWGDLGSPAIVHSRAGEVVVGIAASYHHVCPNDAPGSYFAYANVYNEMNFIRDLAKNCSRNSLI